MRAIVGGGTDSPGEIARGGHRDIFTRGAAVFLRRDGNQELPVPDSPTFRHRRITEALGKRSLSRGPPPTFRGFDTAILFSVSVNPLLSRNLAKMSML